MFRLETQYALRALTAMAGPEGPPATALLARESRVPAPMLSKVLHRLARHGLVVGRPGPGGGYRLARPAGTISLHDVVTALEGPALASSCAFGLPSCSEQAPCPLHCAWKELREKVEGTLRRHSIEDLAQGRAPLRRARRERRV
jgi:Rrf2 family transcriptional regulator, iron-sulfur cluster assembly transcription factor